MGKERYLNRNLTKMQKEKERDGGEAGQRECKIASGKRKHPREFVIHMGRRSNLVTLRDSLKVDRIGWQPGLVTGN